MSTPPTLDGIGHHDAKLPCGSWARLLTTMSTSRPR